MTLQPPPTARAPSVTCKLKFFVFGLVDAMLTSWLVVGICIVCIMDLATVRWGVLPHQKLFKKPSSFLFVIACLGADEIAVDGLYTKLATKMNWKNCERAT